MKKEQNNADEVRDARPWSTPTVRAVGSVGDVLKGGGGKDSISPADPGESRKPKGQQPEK